MADHFAAVASSANVNGSQTKEIYGAVITITTIATVAVILRIVARRKSEASFSYDDYSIVLALVFLYGLNISTIVAAALWGLGKHFFTLSEDQLLHFQKYGLANFALYFTTNATIKLSLLLLYYRLFSPSRRFRIAVYTAAIIVIAWWIAVFFADIFQCVPINAFWNFRHPQTAHCMNTVTFSIGGGVSNLVTDIMVLCLPMPMVWSLSTNRRQKITLTGIFLLGFFVCAISVIRIVQLVTPKGTDPTYSLSEIFIWTCVEPSVGIISACLPIMRPLFGRWLSATVPNRSKSNKPPSANKIPTSISSPPASASLAASPVKGGFTRLEGPTYRDHFEAAYYNDKALETTRSSSDRNGSGGRSVGKKGSYYGDEDGTSWFMYGPSSKGDSGDDGRVEEGWGGDEEEGGMQMQEWERRKRRGGGD